MEDFYPAATHSLLFHGNRPDQRNSRPTAAGWACWPATPSKAPPTSSCRWSPSPCSAARGISSRASAPGRLAGRGIPGRLETGRASWNCSPVKTLVTIEGRDVKIQSWLYRVKSPTGGEVPVLFLDTDIPGNLPEGPGDHRSSLRRRPDLSAQAGDRPRHRRRPPADRSSASRSASII